VRAVDLDGITDAEWDGLIDGEAHPWGSPQGERLSWRQKTRHIGVHDDGGRLIAYAGLVGAEVRAGPEVLAVAGIGGVIVTRACRGRGLSRLLLDRALEVAAEVAPDRAMLFCREANRGVYAKFGFLPLEAPVRAKQPNGVVVVPMGAMWRPLREGLRWPPGEVSVLGEPF
jgi:predicted GNAT family N-acyltransferase